MITCDTLVDSGADITEVLDACNAVLAAARHLHVDCVDELAAADLENLQLAVDLADEGDELSGADRLEVLWPVFYWSWRLTHARAAPAIRGRYRRRFWERSRYDDADRLAHAVDAAHHAIGRVAPAAPTPA